MGGTDDLQLSDPSGDTVPPRQNPIRGVYGMEFADNNRWESLSAEEKRKQLFLNQKKTLDTFLEKHAISQAQYEKSYGDLCKKMGFDDREK